jgi:hypothetical protein
MTEKPDGTPPEPLPPGQVVFVAGEVTLGTTSAAGPDVDGVRADQAERDRARGLLVTVFARVLAIHRESMSEPGRCHEDGHEWPCQTVRALGDE